MTLDPSQLYRLKALTLRRGSGPNKLQRRSLSLDRRLATQLASPTWKLQGERILIESKDDIRKRLGTSTDDADAVILAWHQREYAIIEADFRHRFKKPREPRRDIA